VTDCAQLIFNLQHYDPNVGEDLIPKAAGRPTPVVAACAKANASSQIQNIRGRRHFAGMKKPNLFRLGYVIKL
jgi:hypothetical protein